MVDLYIGLKFYSRPSSLWGYDLEDKVKIKDFKL